MNLRPWRRLVRQSARAAHRAAKALSGAGQRLAERLAYRPREVVVVALLAAGLFGGLMIERWRAGHPATAYQLELEPGRPMSPAPVKAAPRLRPRSVTARCEEPSIEAVAASSVGPRLDLNRATPGELARVAGISWRLAARIIAAREAFEGRGDPQREPDGGSLVPAAARAETEPPGTSAAEPAPDVESR
jgi:hypothetical protein